MKVGNEGNGGRSGAGGSTVKRWQRHLAAVGLLVYGVARIAEEWVSDL